MTYSGIVLRSGQYAASRQQRCMHPPTRTPGSFRDRLYAAIGLGAPNNFQTAVHTSQTKRKTTCSYAFLGAQSHIVTYSAACLKHLWCLYAPTQHCYRHTTTASSVWPSLQLSTTSLFNCFSKCTRIIHKAIKWSVDGEFGPVTKKNIDHKYAIFF